MRETERETDRDRERQRETETEIVDSETEIVESCAMMAMWQCEELWNGAIG